MPLPDMFRLHRHRESRRKYVFAHFMVGNTYPYSVDDWIENIKLAGAHEIDGFVLNVGCETWQYDQVSKCFEAATRIAADTKTDLPFRFFLSFDMSSIPSKDVKDVQLLQNYIQTFGRHPNMHQQDGKVLISTFAGENSLFGQTGLDDAWSFVKNVLQKIVPIHFVPSFFIDPARYPAISSLDGVYNWNGGWPLHLHPGLPRREIECSKLDSDQHHLRHLGSRTFMAAISPWFFTHYGPDSWNKNWIYRGDDWLFVRRWEQLIAMRKQIDIVQVISWNDYGESHYIGPIKGAQPNSQAWVDGFPHDAWLHMNAYFARAFREGKYPHIEKDRIFMWARPHPKDAEAHDTVPRPRNWELTDDVFWVVIFSTAPARVVLSSNDNDNGGNGEAFTISAGVSKLSYPLRIGAGMKAMLERKGRIVIECDAKGFIFDGKPDVYNFNAFTAMSN